MTISQGQKRSTQVLHLLVNINIDQLNHGRDREKGINIAIEFEAMKNIIINITKWFITNRR